MTVETFTACSCTPCQQACEYKPGWFAFGEAEQTAQLLGITLEELFRTRLAVDWWQDDSNVFLLAPALVNEEPGTEYPGDPQGRCTFYRNGLCEIHLAKPSECREYLHGECGAETSRRHERMADTWRSAEAQGQITSLLGREPEASHWGGPWGSLFSGW